MVVKLGALEGEGIGGGARWGEVGGGGGLEREKEILSRCQKPPTLLRPVPHYRRPSKLPTLKV